MATDPVDTPAVHHVAAHDTAKLADQASHPVRRISVDVAEGAAIGLRGMAAKLGTSEADLIERALALYGAYLKFHDEGKLVGAASSESGLDVVFSDF
jgi:hypothetical protein